MLTQFWYPFHFCVTAVARHSVKIADGRLQLNTCAYYLCGFAQSDTVNWCTIVWRAQNML